MLLMSNNAGGTRVESALLSKYAALFEMLQRIGDLVIVVATALACEWAKFGKVELKSPFVGVVVLAMMLVLLVFPLFGLPQQLPA